MCYVQEAEQSQSGWSIVTKWESGEERADIGGGRVHV